MIDLINKFPDQESCIKHLESIIWKGGVCSPFDPVSSVYKASDGRYICKKTRKYFTVLTRMGTCNSTCSYPQRPDQRYDEKNEDGFMIQASGFILPKV